MHIPAKCAIRIHPVTLHSPLFVDSQRRTDDFPLFRPLALALAANLYAVVNNLTDFAIGTRRLFFGGSDR